MYAIRSYYANGWVKDFDLDTAKAYIKGTTKVLWTGPLSVAGVPTSLDVGERFGDWDLIEVNLWTTY